MGHKYVKEDETFNTSQNGVVPKPTAQDITNNKFLRADGNWASGAGGSVVSADQVVTSGTEIGGVTIDGARTAFYAPKSNYSTNEQVIGTWIDGKPVYEKVIPIQSNNSTSGRESVDLSALSIKYIISAQGYASDGNYCRFVPYMYRNENTSTPAESVCIFYQYSNANLYIVHNGIKYGSGHFIIRYTKTTD